MVGCNDYSYIKRLRFNVDNKVCRNNTSVNAHTFIGKMNRTLNHLFVYFLTFKQVLSPLFLLLALLYYFVSMPISQVAVKKEIHFKSSLQVISNCPVVLFFFLKTFGPFFFLCVAVGFQQYLLPRNIFPFGIFFPILLSATRVVASQWRYKMCR
jgi:hypothetical protein